MADLPVIEATAREGVGKGAARTARREGFVPAVIYGGNAEPQSISIKHNVLLKALKKGKFLSTLINVKVDGQDNRVICRDVQRDVVLDLPIHADFLRLSERSRINLFIPVEFINEETCPGLKHGGVLNIVRHDVELKVRAGDIPEKLVVDLAALDIGDVAHISDVELPAGAQLVIADRDFSIATIAAPSGLKAESDDEDEEGAEEEAEDDEE
jgi:large subunit ribosomal protein L25